MLDLIIGIFCATLTLFALHTHIHRLGIMIMFFPFSRRRNFGMNDAVDCLLRCLNFHVLRLCQLSVCVCVRACIYSLCGESIEKFHSKFKNEKEPMFALKAETPYHLLNYSQHHHHRRRRPSSSLLHYCSNGMLAATSAATNNVSACDSERQPFVSAVFSSLFVFFVFVSERSERID